MAASFRCIIVKQPPVVSASPLPQQQQWRQKRGSWQQPDLLPSSPPSCASRATTPLLLLTQLGGALRGSTLSLIPGNIPSSRNAYGSSPSPRPLPTGGAATIFLLPSTLCPHLLSPSAILAPILKLGSSIGCSLAAFTKDGRPCGHSFVFNPPYSFWSGELLSPGGVFLLE
ncbi:hypothetical protein CLOM_g5343 [Closterium sp. NIES-68]|nr:hypothetical protein CLOM_g5343 [Closterium sp. NIES-68]